ncbi:MAG TPA: hypothetical protein VMK42_07955 [Anaeromyxobacteraceae bacterium]|nr:hypothetical protein [Anaeromyxobacteraceae bacterium]
MAEPRSPLKEFRRLEEKLHSVGLSPAEQVRWESLRALVAPGGAPLPAPSRTAAGFDVDAAASALRASLVPAGLRSGAPALEQPASREPSLPAEEWTAPGWLGETPEPAGLPPAEAAASDAAAGVSWGAGPVDAPPESWDPNAPPPEGYYDAAPWDVGTQASFDQASAPGAQWAPQPGEVESFDPAIGGAAEGENSPAAGDLGAPPDPAAMADGTGDPGALAAEAQGALAAGPPGDTSEWAAPPAAPLDPSACGYGARAELFQATPAELASWHPAAPAGPEGEAARAAAGEPSQGEWPFPEPTEFASGVPDLGSYVEFETPSGLAADAGSNAPAEPDADAPPGALPEEEPVEEVALHEITLEDAILLTGSADLEPYSPAPGDADAMARLAEAAQAAPIAAAEEPLPGAELLGDAATAAEAPVESAPLPVEGATAPPESPLDLPPPGPEETTARLFGPEDVEGFALEVDQIGGPGQAAPATGGAPADPDRSIDFAPPPSDGVELAAASEFLSFVSSAPMGSLSLGAEELPDDSILEVSPEDIEEIVEVAEPVEGAMAPGELAAALPPEEEPAALVDAASAAEALPEAAAAEPVDESFADGPGAEVISLDEIAITPPPPHAQALGPPLPLPTEADGEAEAAAEPSAVPPEATPPRPAEPEPWQAVPTPPLVAAEAPPPPTLRRSPAFSVPARTPPLTPLTDLGALAPPAPEADPSSSPSFVSGEHRVVMHTVEGQVLRGAIRDVDLVDAEVPLVQPSGDTVDIAASRVKAIFFMLAPGETPPASLGTKVRVTFGDGRQVAGMSPDYSAGAVGFFVVPIDTRTNTGRIWVYRKAARQISVG